MIVHRSGAPRQISRQIMTRLSCAGRTRLRIALHHGEGIRTARWRPLTARHGVGDAVCARPVKRRRAGQIWAEEFRHEYRRGPTWRTTRVPGGRRRSLQRDVKRQGAGLGSPLRRALVVRAVVGKRVSYRACG